MVGCGRRERESERESGWILPTLLRELMVSEYLVLDQICCWVSIGDSTLTLLRTRQNFLGLRQRAMIRG